MIIDFKKAPDIARKYDVFDARTGESLNGLRIVYADDEQGIYRSATADEHGRFLRGPEGVLLSEHKAAIRIELKPGQFLKSNGDRPPRRVKTLRVSPELLVGFGQRGFTKCVVSKNPLPDDAKIVGVGLIPRLGTPTIETPDICFTIASDTYPASEAGHVPDIEDPRFEDRCPHHAYKAPVAVTFTRDELATLLYDADRMPGRQMKLSVNADGSWTT